jgi:hypothetical protein
MLHRIAAFAFLVFALTSPSRAADQFETSFWLGPPEKFTTLERYQEIKNAGFTLAFPPLHTPSVELNRKILDLCHQVGLRAMIADARMPLSLAAPDAKQKLDAIVADYANHPALYGYFVTDEPSAAAFEGLRDVVAYLRSKDPKHPGFVNLFPTYGPPFDQHGTKTYEEYVDRFTATVKPAVLSYDHYPFIATGDRPQYFNNLAVIRNAATKSKIPFWQIALCVQHYDYRHLTEGELRFQAMHTLAFGGRGLLWYTYWYPGEPNPTVAHALINHDGSRDPHYEMIKQVNADARAIGDELLPFDSYATYHVGAPVEFTLPATATNPTPVESTGPVTVGLFRDSDGRWRTLVASRDYRTPLSIKVSRATEVFDPAKKKWSPITSPASIDLPPAGTMLFR